MSPEPIRVLLVDDHPVVVAGYRHMLESAPDIAVAGTADSGEAAVASYFELRPDVVVMDLAMPGVGGLAATRRILQRDPAARIVIFTIHQSETWLQRAFESGVKGYLTKGNDSGPMIEAVRSVAAGGTYIGPGMQGAQAGKETGALEGLSDREFEVFIGLAAGETVERIADHLNLSPKTVGRHYTAVKQKLGAESTAELVHIALRHHLLDP